MALPENKTNVGVSHGAWGEQIAVAFLKRKGFELVAQNVRPCRWDRRLEIDLVVQNKKDNLLVFVEVKQHKERTPYDRRLRSITKHKKDLLRKACRAWLAQNRWTGAYRFDVIEVFGAPEEPTLLEVDHIERVQLFTTNERYVNWFN